MIEKNQIQSIISKYYLGGLIESAKWEVRDNHLSIDFMSPNKDMVGSLTCDGFPIEDCDLAIFNTSQLNKLLQITAGQILVNPTKTNKVFTKLTFQDANFTVEYSLADPLMVQTPPTINEPEQWDVSAQFEPNDLVSFTKAATAISGNELVTLRASEGIGGSKILEFIFGAKMEFSNKVEFIVEANHNISEGPKIPFNSEMLKEIIHNNKGADSARILFSQEGLLKLEFEFEEVKMKTSYYAVRKADY